MHVLDIYLFLVYLRIAWRLKGKLRFPKGMSVGVDGQFLRNTFSPGKILFASCSSAFSVVQFFFIGSVAVCISQQECYHQIVISCCTFRDFATDKVVACCLNWSTWFDARRTDGRYKTPVSSQKYCITWPAGWNATPSAAGAAAQRRESIVREINGQQCWENKELVWFVYSITFATNDLHRRIFIFIADTIGEVSHFNALKVNVCHLLRPWIICERSTSRSRPVSDTKFQIKLIP